MTDLARKAIYDLRVLRKAMNILLVYPRFPNTYWGFRYALRFIRRCAAMPPLPLVTVAALLPREWSLRLVDENIEKLTDADLAWADMVFFSAMAIQQESLFVSIARAKRACKRVVLGGPYATSYHDEIRESAPGMVDNFIL